MPHILRSSTTQRALLLGLSVGLLAACGSADSPTDSTGVQTSDEQLTRLDKSAPLVASRDKDGTPRFIWASQRSTARAVSGSPADAGRAHLVRSAATLGISAVVANSAKLASEHVMEGGGSVLTFTQEVTGIEIFGARASMVLDATNNLVAISGNLRSAAGSTAKTGRFLISPEQAIARAYADQFGVKLAEGAVSAVSSAVKDGEYRSFRVTTPASAPRIIDTVRARKIYFGEKGRLVAAYHAEFLARAAGDDASDRSNDAWLYAIAADDGRTLVRNSLTANEKFSYRVYAETGQHGIPTDGPLLDSTPLAKGPPVAGEKAAATPILITVDGFNKNPQGKFDPWLTAAATETKGNNVDAYSDRNSKPTGEGDGFEPGIDIRADLSAPGTRSFDRAYDLAQQPNSTPDQMKASITQLFYTNNWMHDYWYDSGFDEKSGNAQESNYGRGGLEGDALHVEAQDGADVGSSNNANMSTFADGKSPRMQMFIWSGKVDAALTSVPPVTLANSLGVSGYGTQVFSLTGATVVTAPADACPVAPAVDTVFTNAAAIVGKIAVIDRGACNFSIKALAAQKAGATGVIFVNNAPGGGIVNPGGVAPEITIPQLIVSLEDGTKLKEQIARGPLTVSLKRKADIKRDGSLDNTIVAHEWGHYLHHRLVQCGGQSCGGMSEGWADFNAVMMVIKSSDSLDATFPLAQYASVSFSDFSSYFGIRRAPYSTDIAVNPFTFKHIRKDGTAPTTAPLNGGGADLAEVHNVGEIWAQMLFEGYTNLLRDTKTTAGGPKPRLTFAQAKRRMANYIVGGMKAAPADPTFVEQRDALLAVAYASDKTHKDFAALSAGFAKRGLGVGAIAPPADSEDLNEAVESDSSKGLLAFVDSTIDDSVKSCDKDGFLDGGEKGEVTIRIRNAGWATLTKGSVTVATVTPGIKFANDGKATIKSLDPYGMLTIQIGVEAAAGLAKQAYVPFTIALTDPESFTTTVTGNMAPLLNFDVAEKSSSDDNVESPKTPWTLASATAKPLQTWARTLRTDAEGKPLAPQNFVWHGNDAAARGDESLVSPSLVVSDTAPFKISFTHRYSFESAPASETEPAAFFDGGAIEFSTDDGKTWVDIATLADPGYTQTIFVAPPTDPPVPVDPEQENPLAGRKAFGGDLLAWTPVTVDLGAKLAGKTVKIRFRIGTDGAAGAPGWDIDDLSFSGINNKPFSTITDNKSTCHGAGPVLKVEGPHTAKAGDVVKLSAAGSSNEAQDALTFKWEQLDGTDVTLKDASTSELTFTAPSVTAETKLTFRVTVSDATESSSEKFEVTISPTAAEPTPGEEEPGGTTVPGAGGGGGTGSPGTLPQNNTSGGCAVATPNEGTSTGTFGLVLGGIAMALGLRRRRNSKS